MKKIALICSLLSCFSVLANDDFQRELLRLFDTVEEIEESHSAMEFSKMRIRLRAKVGVEVPLLGSLDVRPFLDFHLTPSKP